MRDRRSVDELSIEELEELLRLRKRQARLERVHGKPEGREVLPPAPAARPPLPVTPSLAPHAGATGQRYSAVIESAQRKQRRGIRWDWIGDRLLLIVELLAVVGLVLVTAQLARMVRGLNEESQVQQAAPTATPTPAIGVFLLPGGHMPPDAQGDSEPVPIPAHLRNLVGEITPLPAPTPGPEHAQRIVLPGIGVDAPVVEGDDWESLKKGAGHHLGSVNPGERGNCIISAHNDIYGEIFRDLSEVKVGDEILVYTPTQVYRYTVQQSRIIEPTDVSVMAQTSGPVLTLISCYPYGVDTHRIIVIATLES